MQRIFQYLQNHQMSSTTSIKASFHRLESVLSELRQGVEQAVSSEQLLERQLDLNKDMAETWGRRFQEKATRGEQKLATVAQQQRQHHITVVANFESDLKISREHTTRSTKLINQLDQISGRFRVLSLLLTPVPSLENAQSQAYSDLIDDVCQLFTECNEDPHADQTAALTEVELRLEKLEAETIITYDTVPADQLASIVDSVVKEKHELEEDRRRNQQMVETWESRQQLASTIGEETIVEPAEARKLTYQIRVSHLDKSLKLLTAISAMLEKKLKCKSH
jgi:phage shock protein A